MKSTNSHATQAVAPAPVPPWPEEDLEVVKHCPVCGSSQRHLLHEVLTDRVFFCAPGSWTLFTCESCGSAYLDPRPTPSSIGRAYAAYYTHAGHEPLPADRLSAPRRLRRTLLNGYRNWRFGTHLAPASLWGVPLVFVVPGLRESLTSSFRHLPRTGTGHRLLDVGAGNGDFLALVRSSAWAAQGVELDPKAVATCRDRGLDVHVGRIEQFSDERACFDFIVISHVVEHVHEPRALLQRAFDLLKPGGCLYVDTPNIHARGHRAYGDSWRGLEPPRHLVLFNWRALEGLIRSVGFNRIVAKPRAGVWAQLAAKSRALRHGDDWHKAKTSLGDHLACRAFALRMLFTHQDSEFVTLLAYKPMA